MRTSRCNAALLSVVLIGCVSEDRPRVDETPAMEPVIVAEGLNGPAGVLVDSEGVLWIADAGTGGAEQLSGTTPGTNQPITFTWGETARIIRVDPDGTTTDVAMLPSIMIPYGAIGVGRFAMLDGSIYATVGGWEAGISVDRLAHAAAVVRVDEDGVTEIANTWDLENRENPDAGPRETNPWGLTTGPDGALWVTDAAANSLLRVDPGTGEVELKAVFDVAPGVIPNPDRGGAMEREAVPTAVAFDAAGNVFVALLGGFPFQPGNSRVVRVAEDGLVTDHASGLTMLADLVTGPDGQLYGVSLTEFTQQGPTPASGALIRIRPGAVDTLLAGLAFPTAVAFGSDGDTYLALNPMGQPGAGTVVVYPGLVR